MRILLADDHPLFRDGVASLLRSWGHDVIGQAGTADDAVGLTAELAPDLVLMDVRMPGSGLAATRAITALGGQTRIVMLTVSEDEDDLFAAIKAGAQGYLLKNLESTQFRAMLEAAERGEAAITPATAIRILAEYRTTDLPEARAAGGAAAQLTERELDVLRLVTAGLRNKEIAVRLGVSENTAKFHLRNILEKLHAESRTELATRALREGLVEPEPTPEPGSRSER
ncbi:MAG TPA: response regulator transcription factor [Candidatus Binatus sp.]|nr:response regulator transcription factor [Candidatus Binatus sp.]